MFFTGSLQEGISVALQHSRLVACFVTDNQEESNTWENDYLRDETIARSLETDAVVLRLEAGSEGAGYLAAIFPLPKTPTLVIIRNGELKEYIASGTTRDEFLKRVGGAFSARPAAQSSQSVTPGTAQPNNEQVPAIPTSAAATNSPPAETPPAFSSSSSPGQAPPPPAPSDQQALLTEAEQRRQAARKEREEIEKERRRRDKGKQPAGGDGKQQPDAVKKASQQLAERQRQAREERARVLRLIEDDKAERRAREERRRQERAGDVGGGAASSPLTATAASSSSIARTNGQCAIQVRLFDGSTIRTRLPCKATLAQDVRRWIEENRTDGRVPFTFKVILTPLPNRAVDPATEEDKTLEELGLTPSSTLVLTPVDRYSSAYTNMNAGLSNPVSRFITAVLAFVTNILGGIAGALGGLGSGGSASGSGAQQDIPLEDENPSQGQATGRDGGGRIKGFQNPNDSKRDYQLYNGNSLNFEPRKDDEDKDK